MHHYGKGSGSKGGYNSDGQSTDSAGESAGEETDTDIGSGTEDERD